MTRAEKSSALRDLLCPTAFVAYVAMVSIALLVLLLIAIGTAIVVYLDWWEGLGEERTV